MKTQEYPCKNIKISDVDGLNQITVFLEDFETGQGKITITIWDEVWTSYWGGMGNRKIDEFFCSCDHHYLANKLSRISSTENNYDAFRIKARKYIGKRLAGRDIDKKEAKHLLTMLKECEIEHQSDRTYHELSEIFGNIDWMHDIPQKPSHDYIYLCKVIDTIKEALSHSPK